MEAKMPKLLQDIKVLLNTILLKEQNKLDSRLIKRIKHLLSELDHMDKGEIDKKIILSLLGDILDRLPQIIALMTLINNLYRMIIS